VNLVLSKGLCIAGGAFEIKWLTEVTVNLKGKILCFFFSLSQVEKCQQRLRKPRVLFLPRQDLSPERGWPQLTCSLEDPVVISR